MSDRMILLPIAILCGVVTFYLYGWQAKKQVQYNGDERWQLIQIKANNMTKRITDVFVVLMMAAAATISLFNDVKINVTVTRIAVYILFFWGFRNAIELFTSLYYDKRL